MAAPGGDFLVFKTPVGADLGFVGLADQYALLAFPYPVFFRFFAVIGIRFPGIGLFIKIQIGGKFWFYHA